MTPEQFRRVSELYQAALELEFDERAAFLDRACGSDEELRREAESLLQAHERAGNYFAAPAMQVAAGLLPRSNTTLLIGRRLGHYQVLSLLGAGGMGEVYLAEDTRLGRKVALKLLPAAFTQDQERVRRFKQEARAASSLNHPNIVTIHEIDEASTDEGSAQYIVSEFVAGETLRAVIERGRLEISNVIDFAEQVASALSVAHEAGIIHRDIKPENVMARPDGLVKVLDFGLAKLTEAPAPDSEASTLARLSTEAGVIMGTVSYMSPEQARGLKVDHRTDIFSLGVMLYEMVADRLPFEGETTSDVIAAILQTDPLPLSRPGQYLLPELEQLIRRMIEKNREARCQSAVEAQAELRRLQRRLEVNETSGPEKASSGPATSQLSEAAGREGLAGDRERATAGTGKTAAPTAVLKSRARWLPFALFLALLALGASVFWLVKLRGGAGGALADNRPVVIKTAQLTTWRGLDFYPALARDGNTIAFSSDRGGSFEIYIKQLIAGAREVQLTADGGQNFQPDFSPDGSLIAYHSKKRGGIWVVPVTGGAAKQLSEFGSQPAFSPDGSQIAFQSDPVKDIGFGVINALPPSTLWTVPSKGGEPKQLTQAGAPPGGHGSPSWSPDGKRITFDAGDIAGIAVYSVSAQGNDLKNISGRIRDATDSFYAPDGRSIFVVADTGWSLYKISLSEAGDPVGEPAIVFSGSGTRIRYPSIATNGKSIAYSAISTTSNLWAIPLAPNANGASGKPVQLTHNANTRAVHPAFSPDGRKIAYHTFGTGITYQIWTMDADGGNQTQITTGSGLFPWWFPDGGRIAFESRRENRVGLWSVTIEGGKEKKLFDFEGDASVARLSPDGKQVAFNSKRSGTLNLWLVPIEGGQPKQLTFDKEFMGFPAWSPDGKWIALQMKRGEDLHIAIMPSGGGEPTQLTFDHGQSFLYDWSPDGEYVLFAGERKGVWNVRSVSRTTRQQKQITKYTSFNSYVRWPAWSPLGDKIVYEYAETTGNIWLTELK